MPRHFKARGENGGGEGGDEATTDPPAIFGTDSEGQVSSHITGQTWMPLGMTIINSLRQACHSVAYSITKNVLT